MKLSEKQAIFAVNVASLINYIDKQGYRVTFGETFRTPEQADIYAKNGKGIKNSLHCKRLSVDLNLFSPEGEYLTDTKSHEPFGKFWKSLHKHNRHGGDFKKPDGNHYEMQDI